MTRVVSPPFTRANSDDIHPGAWTFYVGGKAVENPSVIDGWDYGTDFRVTRTVFVDVPRVRAFCGLGPKSTLSLAISWHSSWTNLRGWSNVKAIESKETDIAIELSGGQLGGTLTLDTNLVLSAVDTARSPVAANRAGSLLWRDRISVVLEGESSRFPTQLADLGRAGVSGGNRAAWFLRWNPADLESSTLGNVRLLLNREHPVVARSIEAESESGEGYAVRSALKHDIARQLLNGALENEDFDPAADYGPGTLGAALKALLNRLFPGESLASLRGFRATAPSDFEARLQAAVDLLWY
jgi:hypothetical protein